MTVIIHINSWTLPVSKKQLQATRPCRYHTLRDEPCHQIIKSLIHACRYFPSFFQPIPIHPSIHPHPNTPQHPSIHPSPNTPPNPSIPPLAPYTPRLYYKTTQSTQPRHPRPHPLPPRTHPSYNDLLVLLLFLLLLFLFLRLRPRFLLVISGRLDQDLRRGFG